MKQEERANMKGGGRIDYIDIAKGLGMMTIIWGHIVEWGITNSFVYAFHIPLFFFLSGLVFNRQRYVNYKHFLIKKIKSLLVPYAIFSFVTWLFWVIYNMGFLKNSDGVSEMLAPLFQTFIAQGSGGYLIHNVPLWFITCLFVVENVYWVLSKYKPTIRLVIVVICAIIGYFMNTPINNSYDGLISTFDFTRLPWNIEVSFSALIFFAIGHGLIEKYSHKEMLETVNRNHKFSIGICVLLWLCVLLGGWYNGHVSMGSNQLGNPFVFYGAAICGIFAMMLLTMLLSVSSYTEKPFMRFIKWFGRNSYYAMAIHNPIKGVVVIVVAMVLSRIGIHLSAPSLAYEYIVSVVAFVITVIAVVLGIIIINVLLRKVSGLKIREKDE